MTIETALGLLGDAGACICNPIPIHLRISTAAHESATGKDERTSGPKKICLEDRNVEPIATEAYMLKNMACYKIKDYVADNRLKPGDKLPTERDLAVTLGVSRPVIREALGTLEALGYIYKKRGKGIFVKEANFSSLFQEMLFLWNHTDNQADKLLEFRMMLEQAAVGHIIDRSEDEGQPELGKLLELLAEAERQPLSKKAFAAHDYQFHRELLGLTNNALFIQLTSVINDYFQMAEARNKDNDSADGVEESLREHRAIVERIQAKDKIGASDLLRAHLMKPLLRSAKP